MIAERLFPGSVEELFAGVSRAVRGCSSVVVQAGHFLLYYDRTEDLLLPAIASELRSPRHEVIRQEIGYYPLLTWKLALDWLISVPDIPRRRVIVAVNDWQYLPKDIDPHRFYQGQRGLPSSFLHELEKAGSDVVLVTPKGVKEESKTGPFFSESALRRAYEDRVNAMLLRQDASRLTGLAAGVAEASCDLAEEVGRRHGVYCSDGGASCTQEVAELIRQLAEEHRFEAVVNFAPKVCSAHFEAGTELCYSVLCRGPRVTVNVGMETHRVKSVQDLLDGAESVVHQPEAL